MELTPRSAILLFAAANAFVVAILLLRARTNRRANVLLSALLIVTGAPLGPQILGFAGAFDSYPWLSFIPLSVSLAIMPLVYLYVFRLLHGEMPSMWALHLMPGFLQFLYYALVFVQPLSFKDSFFESFHSPYFLPLEFGLVLVISLIYLIATMRVRRKYVRWSEDNRSDSQNFHLSWLRNFLFVVTVLFAAWAAFEVINLVRPLTYVQGYVFYLLLAAGVYYLGIEGYRNADLIYPSPAAVAPDEVPPTEPREVDWKAMGAEIAQKVADDRLFLDPDLTLKSLARRLGSNTWTLSRAINLGREVNFNAFVNEFRVAEVKRRLASATETTSMLDLARDCGFNSKTSFNRSFKAVTGMTPSAYRTQIEGAKS